ncbi:hypothetical protein, partial [Streptomyces scabiei]|uniref:hypothetical protein n=1 Tax=Streptomyces scabiei TaxID=1930 RepID=UPI001F2BA310
MTNSAGSHPSASTAYSNQSRYAYTGVIGSPSPVPSSAARVAIWMDGRYRLFQGGATSASFTGAHPRRPRAAAAARP